MSVKIADAYISVTTEKGGLESALSGSLDMTTAWSVTLGGLIKDAIEGVIGIAEAAGKAIVGFLEDSVDSAANLEQKMADVQASMRLTSDETAKLKDLAINLGLDPTLKVTTLEAADAIKLLGKNGMEAKEIEDGLAKSTVQLANATGGQMTVAAVAMSQAMRIFGIDTKDAGSVVDGITGAINNSKMSLNDYRLALSQGGASMRANGVELSDFNTLLVQNQDAYSSASQGGTMMRYIIQSLTPDTKEAASAMRQLGLLTGSASSESMKAAADLHALNTKIAALDPTSKNYNKELAEMTAKQKELEGAAQLGNNAFYNQNGTLKSGAEITQLLHDAFKDLTEEEKANLSTMIFHSRASGVAMEIAKHTAEEFNNLSAQVNKVGNATESGAIRMGTFKGAVEIFGGVIEALQIKLGDPILKPLQNLNLALGETFGTTRVTQITGFFAQVGTRIGSFITEALTPMAVKWLPLIIDALLRFGQTILGVIPQNETLRDVLDRVGQKIVDFITWLGNLMIKFAGFQVTIANAQRGIMEFIGPIATAITSFISWKDIVAAVVIGLGLLLAPIATVVAQLALLVAAVAALRNAWENDWGGIRTYTTQVFDELKKTLKSVSDAFGADAPAWARVVKDAFGVIAGVLKTFIGDISNIISTLLAMMRGDWARAWELAQKTVSDHEKNMADASDKFIDGLKILFVNKAPAAGKALPDGIKQGIEQGTPALNAAVTKAGAGTIDSWQLKLQSHSPSLVFSGLGMDLINGLIQGLQNGTNSLIGKMGEMANNAINAVRNAFSGANFSSIGQGIADGIKNGIAAGQNAVTDAAKGIIDAAKAAAAAAAAIKSPSRVFASDVGLPIAQGIGQGILSGLKTVASQMATGIKGLVPSQNGSLGAGGIVGAASGSGLLSGLSDMLSGLQANRNGSAGMTITQNFYFGSVGSNNMQAVANAGSQGVREALRQAGQR